MKKYYRVSYILSGITERIDDFDSMTDNSIESAIKAIRDKFNGVWGFDPNAIEILSIEEKEKKEMSFIDRVNMRRKA